MGPISHKAGKDCIPCNPTKSNSTRRGRGASARAVLAAMRYNVLAVLFDQPGFAVPNSLERCFQMSDLLEIFREQGDNFIIMDRHKLTHRGLDIFQKFNLNGAFLDRRQMDSIAGVGPFEHRGRKGHSVK
jgi:hypothetical protein